MWKTKFLEINGVSYLVSFKHYDLGSVFGIDEGRISKLTIEKEDKIVCRYDRGWDMIPKDKDTNEVLKQILKEFN